MEDKKIKKGRQFSHAGLQEINEMHDHLVANLRQLKVSTRVEAAELAGRVGLGHDGAAR